MQDDIKDVEDDVTVLGGDLIALDAKVTEEIDSLVNDSCREIDKSETTDSGISAKYTN